VTPGRAPGLPLHAFLAALILLLSVAALGSGRLEIGWGDLASLLALKIRGGALSPDEATAWAVLVNLRLPRLSLALLAGGALSASGAAYQCLFRNPLVSPDILGVTSGAGAGAALAIILGLSGAWLHLLAFGGGAVSVFLVVAVSRLAGRNSSMVVIVLAGVAVSSLFTALGSFLKYLTVHTESLSLITLWLMGSFARTSSWGDLGTLALFSLIGLGLLFQAGWRLNALAFGEEEAASLGVNTSRVRLQVIGASTLLTASTVALCGMIGWVGLIVPHLARLKVGPSFTSLLPASFLLGALFALGADCLVRLALPGEMPVGIVTSSFGAPLFIRILLRNHRYQA
jgi:iron complex transport system permease protein